MDSGYRTIADLAMEFAVSYRTIRFYEEKGLLAPTKDGVQRLYSDRDRTRLSLVLEGKRLGFSLAEIKSLLEKSQGKVRNDVDRARLATYLTREEISARIAELMEQAASVQSALLALQAMLAAKPEEEPSYPRLRRYARGAR